MVRIWIREKSAIAKKDRINKMNNLMSLFKDDADGQISMKVEDFEYAGNQCIS